jgi:hypothetical protein
MTSTKRQPSLATLFSRECTAAEQILTDRHKHLTEALAHLDTATHNGDVGAATLTRLTARVIATARDLTAATRPVIDHLPAITAALADAADYRGDNGGWCADCNNAPGDTLCGDHAQDRAIATAYETARDAITG